MSTTPSDLAEPLRGRYRLVELVAEGALSRVYRCFDTETETFVIAKVLTSRRPSARVEFADAGDKLRKVPHPNLVTVLDAGIDGNRAFHIVEPIDGVTVSQRVHMFGPLPSQMASRAVNSMLDALHALHEAGLMHGSLHPTSIIADRKRGVILTGSCLGAVHPLKNSQLDPAYQAPEVRGGQDPDRRSEVYAAGAVLYHLLTDGDPTRLHLATPDDNMFSLMPQVLEEVILGACGLHPADRFPDARQFRAALTAAAGRLPDDPMGVHPVAIEEDDETTLVPFDTDALVAEVTGSFDNRHSNAATAGLAERVATSRSKSVDDRSSTPGSVVASTPPSPTERNAAPATEAETPDETPSKAASAPRELGWENEETVLMAPPTEDTELGPAPTPPPAEGSSSVALPLLLAGVTFAVLVVVGIAFMAMS